MEFVPPGAFTPPPEFVSPPAPNLPTYDDAKGVVVIESDDGNREDYTVWLALFRRRSQQVSPFAPFNEVKFSPCVNPADIGAGHKMTVEMLQTLYREGHEIQSHGRHHRSLGTQELAEEAQQGATSILVTNPGRLGWGDEPYEYVLAGGGNSEVVSFHSRNAATSGTGVANLRQPLQHAYPAGSTLTMTEASARALLEGCIEDLAAWGIECRNHAAAWYEATPENLAIIAEYFDSNRGAPSGVNLPSAPRSRYELGYKELTSATLQSIEADLDAAAAEGGVYIFMGHAETDPANLAKLDHLITQAWARGMRIVTRAQALEYMDERW